MTKNKAAGLCITIALLVALSSSLPTSAYTPDNVQKPGNDHPDSVPSASIENAYIKALTSSGGRFIIGTTGGDPNTLNDDNKRLLYGYPDNVGSSFSTLRVGNGSTTNNYRLGNTTWAAGIAPTAPPSVSGNTITTVWLQDGIRVEEKLYFAQNSDTGRLDTTSIEYNLRNDNSSNRNVGLRIMLDVMVGGNDGAPYFIEGVGYVTQQTEWTGNYIPDYWVSYESPTFATDSLKGRGQLIGSSTTRPDRFVIADWPQATGTVWDYTVNPIDAVTNDSATILYYNPVTLGPGQTKTYRTFYGIAKTGDVAQLELIGLEVTQAIQDWNNSVVLIQDRPTFVRAHVRSTAGTVNAVTAEIIGTRNGNPLPGSPLQASNVGRSINVLANPNRSQLNDSFYFELPSAWRNGTVDLELRGVNKTIVCKEHADTDNDCKAQATFVNTPQLDVRIVGAVWKQSNGTVHAPTFTDKQKLVQEIEAVYPVSSLHWDNPYDFELRLTDFVQDPTTLNIRLAEQRVLDGCVNILGLGCQRLYLGVIVDPPTGTTLLGLGGFPTNVASGFWIDTRNRRGVLPHELGHALGRQHSPFCGAVTLPGWTYPYPDGHISPVDEGDNALYGFHISTLDIYGPTTGDLMSYCFPVWPSDWTYKNMRDEISRRFQVSNSIVNAVENLSSSPVMLVSGRVTSALNTGEIESVYKFDLTGTLPVPISGVYSLRLEDANGNSLATYPFQPESAAQCPPNCSEAEDIYAFALAVPFNPQATQLQILNGSQVLVSRLASAHAPQVEVVYPNGNESLDSPVIALSWSANDADNDRLNFAVQYSADDGVKWKTLTSNWYSTTYDLRLDSLAGTDQGLIRILASDGFHTAQDQSNATFTVAKHAPQPDVQVPENSLYVENQTIILDGAAYDNEDGPLNDAALTWSSNLNGPLGTGRSLAVNAMNLAEGTHTLTLTAHDSDGQTSSRDVTVQVYRTRPVLPSSLATTPSGLHFDGTDGWGQTDWQLLSVRNEGDGALTWSASSDLDWIRLSALGSVAPTDILVAADPSGLRIGEYTGHITVTASGAANSPQVIEVSLSLRPVHSVFLPVVLYAYSSSPAGWSATSGLTNHTVYALAPAPSNCSVTYAATDQGIYKSTDGGATWIASGLNALLSTLPLAANAPNFANGPATAILVSALAVDPLNSQIIYAGTWGSGIYKSTNGGDSWTAITGGLPDLFLYALAIDPTNGNVVYAGTSSGGVFKSSNGGTWMSANAGLDNKNIRTLTVAANAPTVLYAGTTAGVYRSSNSAGNWSATGTINSGNVWALASLDGQTAYAGINSSGIYRSSDSGANWTLVNTGLASLDLRAIVFDPDNASTLYASTNTTGVFRSDGTTWADLNVGLDNLTVKSLALGGGACHTLLAGTANGVWRYQP